MDMRDFQSSFAHLHQWLEENYELTEPALSQVTASLVQTYLLASGVPIRIKAGEPLEVGFISSKADGELHGSLDINLSFEGPLTLEPEE